VVKWSLVEDVARFVGMALLALLYLKFWDTLTTSYSYLPLRSEMLAETLQGSQALVFWGGEIILGGVLPAVMMLTPKFRKSINAMLFASSLVVAGLITNRWEVTMTGVLTPLSLAPVMPVATTGHYGPTWLEWATVAGIIAYGLLALSLGVRYLPILPARAQRIRRKVDTTSLKLLALREPEPEG